MPFRHGNNAPAAVLHPVQAAFPACLAPSDETGEAALRIAVGPRPTAGPADQYFATVPDNVLPAFGSSTLPLRVGVV